MTDNWVGLVQKVQRQAPLCQPYPTELQKFGCKFLRVPAPYLVQVVVLGPSVNLLSFSQNHEICMTEAPVISLKQILRFNESDEVIASQRQKVRRLSVTRKKPAERLLCGFEIAR